jgi:hypothetical protein
MNFNNVDWVGLGLGIAGQTVFLTVALWIMLKLQSFERNIPGLIGAAALACALGRIPYVGIAISLVVLLLCITKLIHARTFTDALFTVAIAIAITFAFNMFVLTMLVADLRPSAKVRARTTQPASASEAVAPTNQLASTNPAPSWAQAVTTPAQTNTTAAIPASNSVAASPAAAAPVSAVPAATAPPPEPVFDTNSLVSARMAGDIMKHFFVKGFSQGPAFSIAMISNGTRNFDLSAGDSIQLETSDGRYAAVKCESVAEGRVVISVEGVEVTLLRR